MEIVAGFLFWVTPMDFPSGGHAALPTPVFSYHYDTSLSPSGIWFKLCSQAWSASQLHVIRHIFFCLCEDAVCGPPALLNDLGILHPSVAAWNVLCPRSTAITPLHPWKSLALRWSQLCQVLIKRIMKLNNSCYYANLIARTTTKDSSRTMSALHKNTSWGLLHRNRQFALGLARALHS